MTQDQVPTSAAPMWNGAPVVRFGAVRHILNFWRVRRHREDGLTVYYYRNRKGIVVLAVEAPRGESEQ